MKTVTIIRCCCCCCCYDLHLPCPRSRYCPTIWIRDAGDGCYYGPLGMVDGIGTSIDRLVLFPRSRVFQYATPALPIRGTRLSRTRRPASELIRASCLLYGSMYVYYIWRPCVLPISLLLSISLYFPFSLSTRLSALLSILITVALFIRSRSLSRISSSVSFYLARLSRPISRCSAILLLISLCNMHSVALYPVVYLAL